MSADRIDVLAVMTAAMTTLKVGGLDGQAKALHEARAAVAELIEADREYTAAKVNRIAADNLVTMGDRSDEAYRRQASAHHAYDRAITRRHVAIARVGGAP